MEIKPPSVKITIKAGETHSVNNSGYEFDLDKPIPYEIPKPKVYLIDIDNTLARGVCWDDDSISKAEPVQEMIDKINELHERNFIVIHTARRHERYLATVKWLAKHDVRYHAIRMEKCPGDFIVDADAITKVEDL